MSLRLYNSLTRRLEEFEPAREGEVRLYTCGPTVYDRAHIGNFRTFVWEDLLRRTLRWKGWRVVQVMNLTDVDDRTISAALRRGVPLAEVTGPVTREFFEDWETLGLEPVEHNPRATEHVDAMIELVRKLEERGFTYRREGSVYFAIDRFPGYGRLVRLDPDSLRPGERVEGDEEYSKENPRDFVLWKGGERDAEGAVAVWESPWGPGRPGWHLECSAMAMEYLGPEIDIHTGGVDNMFPHHVNEMAQSEAATGRPLARFWLHAAHLQVEGAKMAKSLGNYHTVASLMEAGTPPSALRYLLLGAHYRSPLNFTADGLRQAERSVERLWEFRLRVEETAGEECDEETATGETGAAEAGADAVDGRPLHSLAATFARDFEAAMDDDLGVSEALGALFVMVREANAVLDAGAAEPGGAAAVLEGLAAFDRVFGVLALREREERDAVSPGLRRWIEERVRERERAREARDFQLADALREQLEERGVVLEDTSSGTRWKAGAAARGGAAGNGVDDHGEPG